MKPKLEIFTDPRDGRTYKTVKIGKQIWMAENLDTYTFLNGDPVLELKSDKDWIETGEGEKSAWCQYKNDPDRCKLVGRLYNFFAVVDPRGLAPEGWHIASDDEWKQLELTIGMSKLYINENGYRGFKEGDKLKSKTGWYDNGNGNNKSGFTAIAGGYRPYNDGDFVDMDAFAYYWTSTECNRDTAWTRSLDFSGSEIYRGEEKKQCGMSVRCVKN